MESEKTRLPQESIEELMDLIRCGDSDSFEELYRTMRKIVLLYYGRSLTKILTKNEWECEARLILHKAINLYRPDKPAGFQTFYARSLQHAIIDRYRKNSLEKSGVVWLGDESGEDKEPDRKYYRAQSAWKVCDGSGNREVEEVLSIIRKDLSLRDLQILRCLGQGFKKVETAKICSVSVKTVRSALIRAQKAWKKSGQNGALWLEKFEQN